ncbi:DUF6890 family protein [Pseudomonas putida]
MVALHQRWLPGTDPSIENLGTAKWLEEEYWRRTEIAVANAIAHALNG